MIGENQTSGSSLERANSATTMKENQASGRLKLAGSKTTMNENQASGTRLKVVNSATIVKENQAFQ